jgi:hypothetical protein
MQADWRFSEAFHDADDAIPHDTAMEETKPLDTADRGSRWHFGLMGR